MYNYVDDYEREWTEKYEGAYTQEEIELNRKLSEECRKKKIDFLAIENLLKQGADPNGGTSVGGWGLLQHIYGDVIGESQDTDSIYLPRLTELFLKYGMDVDNPRVPYDWENSLHPLWTLTFVLNDNSILALKILLDHGISADSFGEFWGHSLFDFENIEFGDPENDEFWRNTYVWTLKMILLGASYDHILNQDEDLRRFICYKSNEKDIHMFRNWNDFEYHFDTSHCKDYFHPHGTIAHIFSKSTGEEVWTIW